MFAKPELAPVAVAGLQSKERIKRTGEESQHHHGDRPQNGERKGLLAIEDPHGEKREASIQVYERNDAPRHGEKLNAFARKIADGEAVDQNDGHGEDAKQGDGFCEFHYSTKMIPSTTSVATLIQFD